MSITVYYFCSSLCASDLKNVSNISIFIYLFALSVFSPGETFTTTETHKCEFMSVEWRLQRSDPSIFF